VTIDTEARTGPAKSLNQTERRTSALAPDFFDTIEHYQTRGSGLRVASLTIF